MVNYCLMFTSRRDIVLWGFRNNGKKGNKMPKQRVLVLNSDWCKGCGICAAFCPKEALKIVNEKAQLVNSEACVLCGQCELRCPDYAIFLSEAEGEEMQWVKPY